MNKTRSLLAAVFLLCMIVGIYLGTILPKQNSKENKLTNGLSNSNTEYKGATTRNKEADIMKNKEAHMKHDASQKDDVQESITQKDTANKDTSNIDTSNKDTSNKDISYNEDTNKKALNKETPNKEKSRIDMKYDDLQLTNLIRKESNPENLHRKLYNFPAETILDTKGINNSKINELFYSMSITDDIKKRIKGKSYSDSCDVPFSDLRYIRLLYMGFDNKTHIGELIVGKAIEKDTLDIFKELYAKDYPIEKMVLIDEYNADDITSMKANNSSAFCYRFVDSTTKRSIHSYGLAIDINPQYNPYIREMSGKTVVLPENGIDYVDRNKDCKYYIKAGDACYQAFTKRGFTWGGDWKDSKDYQHFQKSLDK